MVKKGVRIMIRTFSAPMPTENRGTQRSLRSSGFTLAELVVVILIISLMILLAGTNLYGLLVKNTFRGQLMEIVSVMQMAGNSAAETGRKYEVIFDLSSQSYLVRQITTPDLAAEVLEEEIIASNELGDNCRIAYVIFDDGVYTNQDIAKFRVGRNGWQCGGKIVFTDASERPYSIIVSRLGRNITLKDGDVDIPLPKSPEEVPF
jgi:prepilin-type N-terminal cleavage/methylation domain-containing protein